MGSMDRLPFDILPLIFRYLAGSDLLALALVNRFFSSGALPQMYESIVVNLALTKRLDNVRLRVLKGYSADSTLDRISLQKYSTPS